MGPATVTGGLLGAGGGRGRGAVAAAGLVGSTSFGNKAVFILCGVNTNGQGGAILFGFQHAAKCERRCDIPQFTFTVHTDLPRPPIRNLSSGFLQSESGPNSGGKRGCDPDLPVELANAPVN